MTFPSNLPREVRESLVKARDKWGWFVTLGVLLLILGGIAFANLLVATVASVLFVGSMMLVGGIIEIIHAFGVRTWERFFYWFLSGLLYTVAGILAFYNPLLASSVLTILLAIALAASGGFRIAFAMSHKNAKNCGWIVAAGIISVLAGLLIAIGWPVNSLWVLGMFLAIDLVMQGWAFIAVGLALKR
ncbi:MAG: HdeD family acid-resistance protein [Rhizobiaceae bacterium]